MGRHFNSLKKMTKHLNNANEMAKIKLKLLDQTYVIHMYTEVGIATYLYYLIN